MAEMKARAAIKKAAENTKNGGEMNILNLVSKMAESGQIAKALPKVLEPERFTRIIITAINSNPQLKTCTSESFLGAMMQAAQLGLEPNTPLGKAYLIPYRNGWKGVTECQFQVGYKGLLDLAYRTGEYKDIYAHTVHEGDVFEYELGLEPKLVHKPAMVGRGKPIAYYAVYHLTNGGYGMTVMSYDDVMQHRNKYSPASKKGKSSPWDTDFDSMAKKTVLKQLLKYAPLTTELAEANAADGGVKNLRPEDVTDGLDMSLVQTESADDYIDIEPESAVNNVDMETGEIVGTGDSDMDEILNGGK